MHCWTIQNMPTAGPAVHKKPGSNKQQNGKEDPPKSAAEKEKSDRQPNWDMQTSKRVHTCSKQAFQQPTLSLHRCNG